MFGARRNDKLKVFNFTQPLYLLALFTVLMLSGCGNRDETSNNSSQFSDQTAIQIPDSILANRLDQAAGILTATLSVDGVDQETVTIAGGATTVSFATLNNIPIGNREFSIVFTYDLAPYGALNVAQATQIINVTEGSNPLTFLQSDFDTISFDEDGDGISNIVELDETSISSPVVALCVLDSAVLDDCELGS